MTDGAGFDRAVRLYAEIGLSPERTIGQLLRAGYPASMVRAQFPQCPDALFAAPAQVHAGRLARGSATGQGGALALVNAEALARRVLARSATAAPCANLAAREPVTDPPAAPQPIVPLEQSPSDGISFQYVPLIQCSFPHGDPGQSTSFTRRNGWLELTLSTARADTGLPYGVPARLLTIYCASEAVRQQSPEIYLGRSVHEFLRLLDIPITRGERGSLRVYANQLLRLIHCAISIDENIRDPGGRTGLHIRQALFASEAKLWWDEAEGIGRGSSLVLSPVLYESIVERSAPLSTHAIRQLRKSPMDLDVYAWLVHRLFTLGRPSSMSWEQLSGQFGHSYGEIRYFRRFFGESVQRVLKVYPEARLKWTDHGVLLLPSRPHIDPRPRAHP